MKREDEMIVLIYKRTHRGDPDRNGVFGRKDCLGSVRNRNYDAVIGIGGECCWPEHKEISKKVNWIGIGPKKHGLEGRGPLVTFEKFCLFEENGPDIEKIAPALYNYMFIEKHRRIIMSYSLPSYILSEIYKILGLCR